MLLVPCPRAAGRRPHPVFAYDTKPVRRAQNRTPYIISRPMSYDHPPSLRIFSRAAKSFRISSSVSPSAPLQLALDVRARNLWKRSLLRANTSSMFKGAGAPNTSKGFLFSCSTSARRRLGESAQSATMPLSSSSSSSSSSSVLISGSSIESPFWNRGDDRAADLAVDLATAIPVVRAGVLLGPACELGAKGIVPLDTCAMSSGCAALT